MGLVVPWPGSLLVWTLLPILYSRIIAYEEEILSARFGSAYSQYSSGVPRLRWKISASNTGGAGVFTWKEGLFNNFIYLPLIPGFLVCASTGVLWHGVAVGAIGPLAWIVLHFWRNFKPGGLSRKGGT
jgi:protein-S-isoprenylcysteine O-methyltransferase Ste14